MCGHLGFGAQWIRSTHITRVPEATHALKGVIDGLGAHERNKWSFVVVNHVRSHVGPLGRDAGARV